MLPVFLVGVVGTITFVALTWLIVRFAEGVFRFEFDGGKYPPREMVLGVAGFACLIGYIIVGCATDAALWVPPSALYSHGILGGLMGVLGSVVTGVVGYGVAKILGSVGKIVHGFGNAVNSFAGGLRDMFEGKSKAPKKAVARKPELDDQRSAAEWQIARLKFDDVERACQSLRSQLKEGAAFDQIGDISAELRKVRSAIEEDSTKKSAVPMLLSDYLAPTEQALGLYERLLKRNVTSAQSVLQEMSDKTLPLMHTRIVALYDQIHVGDIARLSTIASAFEVARTLEVDLEAEAAAEAAQ